MSILKLTEFASGRDDVRDECTDTTTAGLLEFGLRQGCTDIEYMLAIRLHELRARTFELVEQSLAEGFSISDSFLNVLDVEKEVTEVKRFSKKSA